MPVAMTMAVMQRPSHLSAMGSLAQVANKVARATAVELRIAPRVQLS
jgi:hypothetical protein